MSWNGSGVVTRTDGVRSGATVWAQAKAAGVKIRTDHHDTHDEDLATAIEQCWNINGENALAASVSAGGFNITNLADGTTAGDAVAYGQSSLRLISTDDSADFAPALTLYRDSASPAVDDQLGSIIFQGEDSAGNEQFYGSITCVIADQTSGSEDSRLQFSTMQAGTERITFRMTAGGTYTFTDFTADASVGPTVTLHRDSATPDDLDVLGGINFDGEDSASTQTTYASIAAVADDVTDGTEDGHFKVRAMRAGALVGCTGPGILQGHFSTTGGTSLAICPAGSIHAEARRITIMYGLSTNGTSQIILQVGDSGGVETTGYASVGGQELDAPVITNGFALNGTTIAALTYAGTIVLTMQNTSTNAWFAHGAAFSSGNGVTALAGTKGLSGVLDRLSITTAGGVNTFDVVDVNVMVE